MRNAESVKESVQSLQEELKEMGRQILADFEQITEEVGLTVRDRNGEFKKEDYVEILDKLDMQMESVSERVGDKVSSFKEAIKQILGKVKAQEHRFMERLEYLEYQKERGLFQQEVTHSIYI